MVAGFAILAVALPLTFLVRSTPESAGLLPDGGIARPSAKRQNQNSEQETLAREVKSTDFAMVEAFHTSSYWLLLMGTVLRLTAKAGVMLHIIPIMVWKGIDEQTAAFIFGFLLLLTVPLSLFFGWLADTLPKNWILFITAVSGTTAFFLLASPLSSLWIIYLVVLLFAIAETSGSNNWATVGDYFEAIPKFVV